MLATDWEVGPGGSSGRFIVLFFLKLFFFFWAKGKVMDFMFLETRERDAFKQ